MPGGGYSASNADAFTGGSNSSVNVLGGQNGTSTDLARIIAAAQGPDANGGFSSVLGTQNVGGLFRSNTLPIIAIGGAILLAALFIWKE